MMGVLCVLVVLLGLIVTGLTGKIILLRRSAEELRQEFKEGLKAESNVGIRISTNDKQMRKLAVDLDRQLKLLRREHIRYERGDRELKDAVTNISHDLRTPLTAICGYMDLLAEEEVSDTVREYLAVMDNRIQSMKELTEELFRYSILFTARKPGTETELSLNAALEECVAGYYGALVQAGIEPKICMPETQVIRKLDGQALNRILDNIMNNAIKYSDHDLQIILKEEGIIHFRNKAARMDEIQVGHLFERFYTVDSGKNSTGLGLSIAKTLTEKMNGRIEADYSEGILDITLTLPREEDL